MPTTSLPDRNLGHIVTITHTHAEIHEGEHFYTSGFTDLSASSTIDFCTVAPSNVYAHLLFIISSDETLEINVYEDATFSLDGTPVTFFNSNRNSTNTANLTSYINSTVTDVGNMIYQNKIIAAVNGNKTVDLGTVGSRNELILKKGSNYIYRMQNVSTSTSTLIYFASFYETETI